MHIARSESVQCSRKDVNCFLWEKKTHKAHKLPATQYTGQKEDTVCNNRSWHRASHSVSDHDPSNQQRVAK